MIFNHRHINLLLTSILLTGCPLTEDNSISDGLVVHIAETHAQAKPGITPTPLTHINNASNYSGGYQQSTNEHHNIADATGRVVALYRAYLVLDDIKFVPCTSLTTLSKKIFSNIIGNAYAHTGHGSDPVAGRALNQPNVINIVTRDEYILPLGDKPIAPGRYCGIRVALVRLASQAYGKPLGVAATNDDPVSTAEVPEMAGQIFEIRADYCAEFNNSNQCIRREKLDINDSGYLNSISRTVDFEQPLEINADRREAYIVIGIAYAEWLQNIDVTLLPDNANELQKLLNNIAESLHIYDRGQGVLPPSVSQ